MHASSVLIATDVWPTPFIQIKMCDQFEEHLARFSLSDAVAYFAWKPQSTDEKKASNILMQNINALQWRC